MACTGPRPAFSHVLTREQLRDEMRASKARRDTQYKERIARAVKEYASTTPPTRGRKGAPLTLTQKKRG